MNFEVDNKQGCFTYDVLSPYPTEHPGSHSHETIPTAKSTITSKFPPSMSHSRSSIPSPEDTMPSLEHSPDFSSGDFTYRSTPYISPTKATMQGNTYNKENLHHNQPMQLNDRNPILRHQVKENVNRTELPIPSTPAHTTASETPNWQGQASLRRGEN